MTDVKYIDQFNDIIDNVKSNVAKKKTIRALKKLNAESISNWILKCHDKHRDQLILEFWVAGAGKSIGTGMKNGVRNEKSSFGKQQVILHHIRYYEADDAWYGKDSNEKYWRAAWCNAYQNPNYKMARHRSEVDDVIKKCTHINRLVQAHP